MESATDTFKGKLNIVKEAEDKWGREEEHAKEIQRLTTVNEFLLERQKNGETTLLDEIETLKRDVELALVEKDKLEEKYIAEYTDQDRAIEAQKRSIEVREEQLKSHHAKKQKKLEAQKAEMKVELEKAKKQEISDLNRTIQKLTEENKQNKAELSKLKIDVDKSDKAYAWLSTEKEELENNLVKIKQDFCVKESPQEYL
jgi:chromosome segregation ATPase